jgi:hypothetical protein
MQYLSLRHRAIIWDNPFEWRVWEGAQGNADFLRRGLGH